MYGVSCVGFLMCIVLFLVFVVVGLWLGGLAGGFLVWLFLVGFLCCWLFVCGCVWLFGCWF